MDEEQTPRETPLSPSRATYEPLNPFLRRRLILALTLTSLAHADLALAGRPRGVTAVIPEQIRDDRGRTFAELRGFALRSIYVFREGDQRGMRAVGRHTGTLLRAEISPDGRFLAYSLQEQSPLNAPAVVARQIQSVIVASIKGTRLDSISNGARSSGNGMRFAWNEAGSRLAILLGGEGSGPSDGQEDSLVIWNATSRGRKAFGIRSNAWEVGWASDDTVLVCHYDGVDALAL